MRLLIPVLLPGLLALGLSDQAQADALALRLRLNSPDNPERYELVAAERGHFPVSQSPSVRQASDLEVVGRDRNDRELFRTRISAPGTLQAEAFDPKTGRIDFARTVQRDQATFEVRVPRVAGLDHLELINAGEGIASRSVGQRIERSALDTRLRASALKPMTLRANATSTVLYSSGPSSQRMDIVLIGDGYTSAQMSQWASDAQKIANGLLADPLFAANKGRFNLRRVDVVSAQSGVDEPDRGIYRNTALGVQVGCYGVDRLVCADENLVYSAVGSVTAADAHDVIVVVANSTRYGGAGGNVATMTMHPSAIELALHEIGHTAFKLADEYDYGTCDLSREPSEANVTRQTSRSAIKWGSLIASNTPLPTPVNTYPAGTVGLFTGGKYCTAWMYRPTEDSRMRTLGEPWYAVNERRANAVFASYAGDDGNTPSPITVNGHLGDRQWANIPSGNAYQSLQGGRFSLQLTGPSTADFDLTLYRWNGSAWTVAARANGPTSRETIGYDGSAGYYYTEVRSYSGSGDYSLNYRFPR